MISFTHSRASISAIRQGDNVAIGEIPYQIRSTAKGGMGLVFLLDQSPGWNPTKESVHRLRVAIKMVLPEFLTAESKALFQRELAVWAEFRHPNVVALNEILDAGTDGFVAAMDCCLGSLQDHLRKVQILPLKQATDIMGHLLDGLAYAFDRNQILHLDLKPANILYDWDLGLMVRRKDRPDAEKWRFMISDWGIASVKREQLKKLIELPLEPTSRIETFNNVGTVLYMAPERFMAGRKSSIASDIFSLGLIYFEMLLGNLPYTSGGDPIEELVSGAYYRHAEYLLRKSTVPPLIQAIIFHCIHPDPEKRFGSYREIQDYLPTAYHCSVPTREPVPPADNSLEEFAKTPLMREGLLRMGKEYALKQAGNLRAVTREEDARNVLRQHLMNIFKEYMSDPNDQKYLTMFTNASIEFKDLELAKETIEAAIAANEKYPFVDATKLYFDLGRILHQLRVEPARELRCYEMSIAAVAPTSSKYVASRRMKAKAHFFAAGPANRMMNFRLRNHHMEECQKLVSDVDLNDPEAKNKFLDETQD